jgi:peptidoglycan/xylan/chitin deacetylase (PgdA/CDA1 family)
MASARRAIAGMLWPASRIATRFRPGKRILMYHRVRDTAQADQLSVGTARFEEHMRSLAQSHRVLSLHAICGEIAAGPERHAVAVTFDDGYTDNLVHALPVLERYRIPATIFVVAEFCDGTLRHPRYPGERDLHLTWAQLRDVAAHPLIEIGSHTLTHPLLSTLDAASARREITDSRRRLEDALRVPIRYFCYPSGDCSQREAALVAEAGYLGAVTVAPGSNRLHASPWLLRRTEMTNHDSAVDLAMKLDGAYDLPHALLHWRRRLRFRRLRDRSGALDAARERPA